MKSKTTIAGLIIALTFLSSCALVYAGKTTFNDVTPVIMGVFAFAGGWGLKNAKDDKRN